MIPALEYAEMEIAVREYDQLRRYISELIAKAHSDLRNGVISQSVCDLVINGLSKTKEDSNERKEFNSWEHKARTDENYSTALNEILRKVWES